MLRLPRSVGSRVDGQGVPHRRARRGAWRRRGHSTTPGLLCKVKDDRRLFSLLLDFRKHRLLDLKKRLQVRKIFFWNGDPRPTLMAQMGVLTSDFCLPDLDLYGA